MASAPLELNTKLKVVQGDRNTLYFHSLATSTKRNNIIQAIEQDGNIHRTQNMKAEVSWNFFVKLMGSESTIMLNINWNQLYDNQGIDMQDLTRPMT